LIWGYSIFGISSIIPYSSFLFLDEKKRSKEKSSNINAISPHRPILPSWPTAIASKNGALPIAGPLMLPAYALFPDLPELIKMAV